MTIIDASAEEALSCRTDEELAAIAIEEHEHVADALVATIRHAIRAGSALLELRERRGAEGWPEFCEDELGFSSMHASRYMRLAHYRHAIPVPPPPVFTDKAGRVRPTSVNVLYQTYVKALPPVFTGNGCRITPEQEAEIRRLRTAGLTYQEIAELVDRSLATVHRVLNPTTKRREVERAEARRRQRRAERKALKEKEARAERDLLAASTGGEVAEAYALVRRALAAIDRAPSSAGTRAALASLHKAEDAIVEALREGRSE